MGTNYYLEHSITPEDLKVIEKYGAELPRLHIGKASCGWKFTFHEEPNWDDLLGVEHPIRFHTDWYELIMDDRYRVINEYGEIIDPNNFMLMVENKQHDEHSNGECRRGYMFVRGEFC